MLPLNKRRPSLTQSALLYLTMFFDPGNAKLVRIGYDQLCPIVLANEPNGSKKIIDPHNTEPDANITIGFSYGLYRHDTISGEEEECSNPEFLKPIIAEAMAEITKNSGIKFQELTSPEIIDQDNPPNGIIVNHCKITKGILGQASLPQSEMQFLTLADIEPKDIYLRKSLTDVESNKWRYGTVAKHELLHVLGLKHPEDLITKQDIPAPQTIQGSNEMRIQRKFTKLDEIMLQNCYNGMIKSINETFDVEIEEEDIRDSWLKFLEIYYLILSPIESQTILGIILGVVKGVLDLVIDKKENKKRKLTKDLIIDVIDASFSVVMPNAVILSDMMQKMIPNCGERNCIGKIFNLSIINLLHNRLSNQLIDDNPILITVINAIADTSQLAIDGTLKARIIDETMQYLQEIRQKRYTDHRRNITTTADIETPTNRDERDEQEYRDQQPTRATIIGKRQISEPSKNQDPNKDHPLMALTRCKSDVDTPNDSSPRLSSETKTPSTTTSSPSASSGLGIIRSSTDSISVRV